MYDDVHIVSLDQRPCVVHYLDHYNKFIVGTYQLFTTQEDARLKFGSHLDDEQLKVASELINNRAGKLILLRGNDITTPSIEYEFDCLSGGGVFDSKISYNNLDSSYKIYVAHSNGSVGVYKMSLHCGNKIWLKEHIKIAGSKMLTSIDLFPDSNNHREITNDASVRQNASKIGARFVVGDSLGFVTVITSHGEPIRENITEGDSIWQVKILRLVSEHDVIVVGAENCSWYIYGLDEGMSRLVLLYKNSYKDFNAGVTSIAVVNTHHCAEYDLIEMLLGSYDETLQTYHVKLKLDGKSRPDVCHKNTISIKDGGIWRIKQSKSNKKMLYIAAMFAGSYALSLDGLEVTSKQQTTRTAGDDDFRLLKLIETESLKLSHKVLHYDIDVSSCGRSYCIVDFNNSLCLFKTIHDDGRRSSIISVTKNSR